jgi:hypothetical protein
MPDAMNGLGIEAGRQTEAHEQLSRALWMRKRGEMFRFLLDPAADPGLTLERIGKGAGAVLARAAKARAENRAVDSGLMLVDGRDGLAFCTTADSKAFLQRLAGWAREAIARTPALALLVDSGVGPLTIDPSDDAAALAYMPDGEAVVYDTELWNDLLEPDAAGTAAALAAVTPGERLWFWLAEDETEGVVPLIVQPIAWDPNHDRTNWLVERNTDRGAGEGVTGSAMICDDGTIQFIAGGLYPDMLQQLARWVAQEQPAHPALGRLVDCQFVVASGDSVDEIIADPTLWTGVAGATVPGTMRATAAILEALPVGAECWFWITGGPSAPPFLHLLPTADDPDGEAFKAALPNLYKRFALSFDDAITGVLSRPSATRIVCSSHDARAGHFTVQIKALLDRYGVRFPALQDLARAVLVQADANGEPHVVAAAA